MNDANTTTQDIQEEEVIETLRKHGVNAKKFYSGGWMFLSGGISAEPNRLAYLVAHNSGEVGFDGIHVVTFGMALSVQLFGFPEIESLQREIAEVKDCLDDLEEINPALVNA